MVLSISIIFIIFIVLIITNIDSITNWVNSLFTASEKRETTKFNFNLDWFNNIGTILKKLFSNFKLNSIKVKTSIPKGYYDHIVLVLPDLKLTTEGVKTPNGNFWEYENFIENLKLDIRRYGEILFNYDEVDKEIEKYIKLNYKEIDIDNNLIYLTMSFKGGLKPIFSEYTLTQAFRLSLPTYWAYEELNFEVRFPDKKYISYPTQTKVYNNKHNKKANKGAKTYSMPDYRYTDTYKTHWENLEF